MRGRFVKRPKANRRDPGIPAAVVLTSMDAGRCLWLGRLLGLDRLGPAGGDLDLPRLHRLGNLAHEVHMQQAVDQFGAADLDEVGKVRAESISRLTRSKPMALRNRGEKSKLFM